MDGNLFYRQEFGVGLFFVQEISFAMDEVTEVVLEICSREWTIIGSSWKAACLAVKSTASCSGRFMCSEIQMKVTSQSAPVREFRISSIRWTSGFEREGSWSEWREESERGEEQMPSWVYARDRKRSPLILQNRPRLCYVCGTIFWNHIWI